MNDRLKELLDNEHVWPSEYSFKFIVAAERLGEVVEILGEGVVVKESKKGKYVSVTLTKLMDSSEAIIELYTKVATVEGVISL
ncbi:MAG: DUF493 family protein [bacterium]|tara:strand:- start:32660 stop:32908 length:249 start_codon:yes stop_codon:yes gene_type:complete